MAVLKEKKEQWVVSQKGDDMGLGRDLEKVIKKSEFWTDGKNNRDFTVIMKTQSISNSDTQTVKVQRVLFYMLAMRPDTRNFNCQDTDLELP